MNPSSLEDDAPNIQLGTIRVEVGPATQQVRVCVDATWLMLFNMA
jgi:hypothetical protein